MERLGYTRYVAQGGDVGAAVTDAMGRQAPKGLARHSPQPAGGGVGHRRSNCRRNPRRNARRIKRSRRSGRVASATSWSSPPGHRRSAIPCWIHPSGSRPGCSTMTRTATTRSPARSSTVSPWAISPGSSIVDNITLYWLTGTGASAARWYWEFGQFLAAAGGAGSSSGQGSRRLHDVPRRDLCRPAQLGRDGLPRPRLLQRGRPRRTLRRLGGAEALFRRGSRSLQIAAQIVEQRKAEFLRV